MESSQHVIHRSAEPDDPAHPFPVIDSTTCAPALELASMRTLGTPVGDQPPHTMVCGDNLAALDAMPHLDGQVDVVYLDPPYNTGNTNLSRYQDTYLEEWVAFMRPRIVAAHRLLKSTGVIMVAIGDDEHHRLRVLLDEVFGASNFVSNVVWQGSVRSDSRWVSNGAEYMLIYARSVHALRESGVKWREPRDGVSDILAAAKRAWTETPTHVLRGKDKGRELSPFERAEKATAALKKWQRSLSKDHPSMAKGLRDYNKVDEHGDVYRYGPIEKPQPGPYRYSVLHPVTGKAVAVPRNGWRMPEERMREMVAAADVVFGVDETTPLRGKLRLKNLTEAVPRSVFESRRSRGAAHLRDVLGPNAAERFPFPKDHEVLMRWLGMAAPRDGLIVDFFGGSGSTLEAVLRLNAADTAECVSTPLNGLPCTCGQRRCVLVTNNEVATDDAARLTTDGFKPGDPKWETLGVFEHVTVPRIRAVIEGRRPDGSTYDDTVAGHVEVFEVA